MQNQVIKQTYWQMLIHVPCRFLLGFVCFILCLIITILSNHGIIFNRLDFASLEKLTHLNILPLLFQNLAWFFILVKILQESKNLSVFTTHIINSIGFLFFVGFFFLYHDAKQMLIDLYCVSSILGLIFWVSPYLNLSNHDSHSVWCFSHKLIKGSFLSVLIAVLLYSSVSIALLTIEKLFQFHISPIIYIDILSVSSLISMIYFVSIIPKEFSFSQSDGKRSKTMQFIINWISIPMSFVYAVILYAYFLKISIIADTSYVTIRELVSLITGFVCVSVLVFWSSFTLQEVGKIHVRLFHKVFVYLMLPLICINLYYIIQNINLVGFTVPWYALLIVSVWCLFIVVACGIQKLSIKYIITSLAVCIFWAGLSPWSLQKIAGYNKDILGGVLLPTPAETDTSHKNYQKDG